MFDYLKVATQLKHAEFIQNREQRQLLEEALLAHESIEPFYYEVLAGLGRQLTDWGMRLQERYARASQMSLEIPTYESASQ